MRSHGRVLFVGAGSAQMPAIRHANSLGYVSYAIDADPHAAGFKDAAGFKVGDIRDPEFVKKCAHTYNVNAIIAVATDVAVPSAARACASLGLPSMSVEAADISVNKLLQRRHMKEAGLNVPAFMPFNSVQEAQLNAGQIGYPVVVKPCDSAGSRGVSLVQNSAGVNQAAEAALSMSRSSVGITEEYIEGVEISVEGFVAAGKFYAICISEKVRTPPPYLLDTEVHFPDLLSQAERNMVLTTAREAVKACGLNNCPVHMEMLRSDKGPVVVELAARGAGFRVFTNILPYVTGIDTIDVQLRLALGESINIAVKEPLKGAVITFLSPIPGRLKCVNGIDEARQVLGVQEVEVYIKPGEIMGKLTCGADRIGHMIVFGENREDADSRARLAMSLIKLEVE